MALIRRDTQILTAMVKKNLNPCQEQAGSTRLIQVIRMNMTDEDLAQSAAAGDRQAFCNLLERCYDRIFGLAFRLTGNRTEAEDLTQDICANLPKKLQTYQAKARFSTWIYRVIVNAAHDRRRRAARQGKAALDWGDWELARQAENHEAAALTDWLITAMQSLPSEIRDTLALVLDDVTHQEAGQILGVSQGTISWRVSQAKSQLRALKAQEQTL